MTVRHAAFSIRALIACRTQKAELLRLCARIGYTPPGDLQPTI